MTPSTTLLAERNLKILHNYFFFPLAPSFRHLSSILGPTQEKIVSWKFAVTFSLPKQECFLTPCGHHLLITHGLRMASPFQSQGWCLEAYLVSYSGIYMHSKMIRIHFLGNDAKEVIEY